MGMMIIAYQSLVSLFPFKPLFEEDNDFLLGYVAQSSWMDSVDLSFSGDYNVSDLINKPHAVLRGVTSRAEGAKALELFATCIPVSMRSDLFASYAQLVLDEDNILTEPMDDECRYWCFQAMEMVRSALGVDNALPAK